MLVHAVMQSGRRRQRATRKLILHTLRADFRCSVLTECSQTHRASLSLAPDNEQSEVEAFPFEVVPRRAGEECGTPLAGMLPPPRRSFTERIEVLICAHVESPVGDRRGRHDRLLQIIAGENFESVPGLDDSDHAAIRRRVDFAITGNR